MDMVRNASPSHGKQIFICLNVNDTKEALEEVVGTPSAVYYQQIIIQLDPSSYHQSI